MARHTCAIHAFALLSRGAFLAVELIVAQQGGEAPAWRRPEKTDGRCVMASERREILANHFRNIALVSCLARLIRMLHAGSRYSIGGMHMVLLRKQEKIRTSQWVLVA